MPGILEGCVGILPPGALGVALFTHLTQRCRRLEGDVFFMERSGSASASQLRQEGQLHVAFEDGNVQIPTSQFFKSSLLHCFEQESLPELVLVATNPDQILEIIVSLVEVLESVVRRGGDANHALAFPATILCSNGIYFQRARQFFIEKIEEATLLGRLPDLWPHLMPVLVGRLMRGVTIQTGTRESRGGHTWYRPGPRSITRLAGSDAAVRDRCCRVLQSKGGWYEAGQGSATRLEFDKALVNLTVNLLGQLYAFDERGRFRLLRVQDVIVLEHQAEIRELARRVFQVGRAVHAYEPEAQFESIYAGMMENFRGHETHIPSSLQWVDLKLREGTLEPVLTPTESWLLDPLIRYARSAGLEDTAEYFESLRHRLLERLTLASGKAESRFEI